MKKILITGASSGLGRDLARVYAKGNSLILIGRNKDRLESVAKEVIELGGEANIYLCDISLKKEIDNLKLQIGQVYESIDLLINNAGIGYFGAFEELKEEDLDAMIDINVKGTLLLTQALVAMVDGKIMNIISTAGLRGKVNEVAYCTSKYALRGFTDALREEYRGKVEVIGVYMGGMATKFWSKSTHIKDKSRLRNAEVVAKRIKGLDDGRDEIIID